MRAPILRVLLLLGVVTTPACGQRVRVASALPAFGSDAELTRFLRGYRHSRALRLQRARAEAEGAEAAACARGLVVRIRHGVRPDGSAVLGGRVREIAGGAPVANAQVSIDFPKVTAVSASADGRYRLVLPAGSVSKGTRTRLTATSLGNGRCTAELVLKPGDSARVDLQLAGLPVLLEEADFTGTGAPASAPAAMGFAAFAPAQESLTNAQEAGVDEGGIVKLHGDHLVVLRRGRLFTVAIGGGRLEPTSVVDAFGPGMDPSGTWYDELLVSDDDVVVVGYSYARGGTELGLFRIDADGRLRYRATYQLRSNDYYSSRNYASRLIGRKLVFYAPLRLPWGEPLATALPALRRWHTGAGDSAFRPIVSATRVYRPGAAVDSVAELALHTVTVCDLGSPELACAATAVLGPTGRVFYVSPSAVYVWTSESWTGRASSMLYRMPLDGQAPSALRVARSPVDQFSFLESDDGCINVLVRDDAAGDEMWAPERAAGGVALLRVRLSEFGDGRGSAPRSAYRALPAPQPGAFHNRFVGGHLLYGVGSGWGPSGHGGGGTLYVVSYLNGDLAQLPLEHGVDRIEAMGSDAVVVGAEGDDLHFSNIALGRLPAVVGAYVRAGAAQGELRSHGFFYRSAGPDSGLIGLPVRSAGSPGWKHLVEGSASVLFLQRRGASIRELGELAARPAESEAADRCVASCVDWYGNARPLFLRGRVFALLGYEIVEGSVRGGRLAELRRISFAPPVPVRAGR